MEEISKYMQIKEIKKVKGYIALMSVIILASVSGLIAVSLYVKSINDSQVLISKIKSTKSRYLSEACIDVAISKVVSMSHITLDNIMDGNNRCDYSILNGLSGIRYIYSTSTVDSFIMKNQVIVDINQKNIDNTIKIISWQEI